MRTAVGIVHRRPIAANVKHNAKQLAKESVEPAATVPRFHVRASAKGVARVSALPIPECNAKWVAKLSYPRRAKPK